MEMVGERKGRGAGHSSPRQRRAAGMEEAPGGSRATGDLGPGRRQRARVAGGLDRERHRRPGGVAGWAGRRRVERRAAGWRAQMTKLLGCEPPSSLPLGPWTRASGRDPRWGRPGARARAASRGLGPERLMAPRGEGLRRHGMTWCQLSANLNTLRPDHTNHLTGGEPNLHYPCSAPTNPTYTLQLTWPAYTCMSGRAMPVHLATSHSEDGGARRARPRRAIRRANGCGGSVSPPSVVVRGS
jgi:hypothetical protein